MKTYEGGGHAYHATMPTDGLVTLHKVMRETEAYGFEKVKQEQVELGARVRQVLEARGFPSVAAAGFQAPGVVVASPPTTASTPGARFAGRRPADRGRRAAGLRRAPRLQGLPHRPVRAGQAAQGRASVATLEKALDQVG